MVLLEGFDYNASRVTEFIEDETIAKDEILYEVTYNENRVRPYIWSGEEGETIRIGLGMEYFRNEFADFMEVKDLVLSELKQHKVSSYETTYVTNVAVKANPETMSRIEKVN